MSTERTLNSQIGSVGLDRDLLEAGLDTQTKDGVIYNPPVDSTSIENENRARAELLRVQGFDRFAPTADDIAQRIADQPVPEELDGQEQTITFPEVRILAGDAQKVLNEIARLRAEVIRAFKHLGVDTRKFFSE